MKLFFIIFVSFVATNEAFVDNTALNQAELKNIARDVLNKVMNSVESLNKIQKEMRTLRGKLDREIKKTDFGIPKSLEVIKIEDSLKKNEDKQGINTCKNLKVEKIQQVIGELKDNLVQKVNAQIAKYKVTLGDIHKTLEDIFNNLSGKRLEEELSRCEKKAKKCRITIEYQNEIKNSDEIMSTIADVTRKCIDYVMHLVITPIIPKKIENDIVKPMSKCISKL